MLPRAHRLTGDANFKALAHKGRPFFSPSLTVKAMRVTGPSQFAFVVSSRVSKKAVLRNRVRRQLREIVRLALPSIQPGFRVMVIVKPQAVGRTYHELHSELLSILTKAQIYHA